MATIDTMTFDDWVYAHDDFKFVHSIYANEIVTRFAELVYTLYHDMDRRLYSSLYTLDMGPIDVTYYVNLSNYIVKESRMHARGWRQTWILYQMYRYVVWLMTGVDVAYLVFAEQKIC